MPIRSIFLTLLLAVGIFGFQSALNQSNEVMAQPSVVEVGDIIYKDDFGFSASGWRIDQGPGSDYSYAEDTGEYRVFISAPDSLAVAEAPLTGLLPDEFVLQADVRQHIGSALSPFGSTGIYLATGREVGVDPMFIFTVVASSPDDASLNQTFALKRLDESGLRDIIPHTPSELINPVGESNRLAMVVQENEVSLFINDVFVVSINDISDPLLDIILSANVTGVYTRSFPNAPNVNGRFDNFTISRINSSTLADQRDQVGVFIGEGTESTWADAIENGLIVGSECGDEIDGVSQSYYSGVAQQFGFSGFSSVAVQLTPDFEGLAGNAGNTHTAMIMSVEDCPGVGENTLQVGSFRTLLNSSTDLTGMEISFSILTSANVVSFCITLIDVNGNKREWCSINIDPSSGLWSNVTFDPSDAAPGPFQQFSEDAGFDITQVVEIQLAEAFNGNPLPATCDNNNPYTNCGIDPSTGLPGGWNAWNHVILQPQGTPYCDRKITKTGEPLFVGEGETVTFAITVENVGTAECDALNSVEDIFTPGNISAGFTLDPNVPIDVTVLNDPAPGAGQWACVIDPQLGFVCDNSTALPSGYSVLFTYSATVTAPAGSVIENCAFVWDLNDSDGNPSNDTSCVEIEVIESVCDRSIDKAGDTLTVGEGGTVTFTITVENIGTGKCDGLNRVGDVFTPGGNDDGFTLDPNSPISITVVNNPAPSAGPWTCAIDPQVGFKCDNSTALPSGYAVEFTYTATVTAPAGSVIENCAFVLIVNEPNANGSNNSTCVEVEVVETVCDRSIAKTGDPLIVGEGESVTFTITVENIGTGKCDGLNRVEDVFTPGGNDDGFTLDPNSPISITVVNNPAPSAGPWTCAIDPQVGFKCDNSTALPSGYAVEFTYTATVTAPAGSVIENCAFVLIVNEPNANGSNNSTCVEVDVVTQGNGVNSTNSGGGIGSATEISLPFSAEGFIDPDGEQDCYVFSINETLSITIDVNAQVLNSALDSVVEVIDENGQIVGFNDDQGEGEGQTGLDSFLTITLEPGTYFICVRGFFGGEGEPSFGFYVIDVQQTPNQNIPVLRPDLVILQAEFAENCDLTVTVGNIGNADVEGLFDFSATGFDIDNISVTVFSSDINGLPHTMQTSQTLENVSFASESTTITVDPGNQIAESDEANSVIVEVPERCRVTDSTNEVVNAIRDVFVGTIDLSVNNALDFLNRAIDAGDDENYGVAADLADEAFDLLRDIRSVLSNLNEEVDFESLGVGELYLNAREALASFISATNSFKRDLENAHEEFLKTCPPQAVNVRGPECDEDEFKRNAENIFNRAKNFIKAQIRTFESFREHLTEISNFLGS